MGAGICIGDTFGPLLFSLNVFHSFLRSLQVDGLLWIWDRGVAFGGPIVVSAGGGVAAGPAGVRGRIGVVLAVMVFLCVRGLDSCFSDNQGL